MEPIGASSTWRWHGYENSWIDLDGRRVQSMTGGGHWGGGMFISARDMARFGYLFLRNGKWVDRQIVSQKWIDMARSPGAANDGYGYMNWFLNSGAKPAFPHAADCRHIPGKRQQHRLHRLAERPGCGRPVDVGRTPSTSSSRRSSERSVRWRGAIDPVDLLVFGPHPDDFEIGLGGTIAKHVAHGHRVGLCDLTAGEMGSNGSVEERLAEADAARAVLGAAWRVNLRWPDRAIGGNPEHVRAAAALVRTARPRTVAIPYGIDRHPDHVAASQVLTEAVFNSGLRRYDAGTDEEAWRPSRSATTSSTTRRRHRSWWTCLVTTSRSGVRYGVT